MSRRKDNQLRDQGILQKQLKEIMNMVAKTDPWLYTLYLEACRELDNLLSRRPTMEQLNDLRSMLYTTSAGISEMGPYSDGHAEVDDEKLWCYMISLVEYMKEFIEIEADVDPEFVEDPSDPDWKINKSMGDEFLQRSVRDYGSAMSLIGRSDFDPIREKIEAYKSEYSCNDLTVITDALGIFFEDDMYLVEQKRKEKKNPKGKKIKEKKNAK